MPKASTVTYLHFKKIILEGDLQIYINTCMQNLSILIASKCHVIQYRQNIMLRLLTCKLVIRKDLFIILCKTLSMALFWSLCTSNCVVCFLLNPQFQWDLSEKVYMRRYSRFIFCFFTSFHNCRSCLISPKDPYINQSMLALIKITQHYT